MNKPEMFSNTEMLKNKAAASVKAEPTFIRYTVRIPELAIAIKLRKGHKLKDWLVRYCETHHIAKDRIYAAYNITEDYANKLLGIKREVKRTRNKK